MRKRHLVLILLLAFVILVGGTMLLIGAFTGDDTGLDTDTPNGQPAIGRHAPLG